MNQNPIRKVLSSIQTHQVQALLMGGQACVFYGAAEFSRDIDLVLLVDDANLQRFQAFLTDLQAERVDVPSFEPDYLIRGHIVRFRCRHPEAYNLHLDVMATLRGVDPFPLLWERRTTIPGPDDETYEALSLPDLVQTKKTQRDRDWPMIDQLVKVSFFAEREAPSKAAIAFWLSELRNPRTLFGFARNFPAQAKALRRKRPLLALASVADIRGLAEALREEENTERERDRLYWEPLRRELEVLRRQERRKPD